MKLVTTMKKNKLIVIVGLVYLLLFIVQPEKAMTAFGNSTYYLVEMLEIMPVIFLLTVAIDVLVPKEWIMKRFGAKSGFMGNVLSLILGSISAGPIYAAFPICKMLFAKGASVANVVIVLSAWAVVKVPMLANEAKFLGPSFMAVRWVLTVIAIFIMGWLMEKFITRDQIVQEEYLLNDVPVALNSDYCVGCQICANKVPEVFEMQDGKARVIHGFDSHGHEEALRSIVKQCPSKTITYMEQSME